MTNGRLDVDSLVVMPGFDPYPDGPNFLAPSSGTRSDRGIPAMAADFAHMRVAFRDAFGQELTFAEGYRSYTMQQQRYAEYMNGGPLAAEPGTSNHGYAQAMDLRESIGTWGSPTHNWMVTNGYKYGFTPISTEAWHWEHLGTTVVSPAPVDAADTGTLIPIKALTEEGTMFLAIAAGKVGDPSLGQIAGRTFKVDPSPCTYKGKDYKGSITWVNQQFEWDTLTVLTDPSGSNKLYKLTTLASTLIYQFTRDASYARIGW